MRSVGLTTLALSGALVFQANAATVPEDPRPGFNLFSVQQDIEVGRQASAQAERELPVIRDASLERYLNEVAQRLVAVSPGARFPYRVRAVDSSDINAFTFPGGFIYVNRGLLAATRNEGELAGVLAHEISHVALRHGTHEASKAYGAQAGLGILGGLLGRGKSGTTQQIIQALGGLGLNAVFMKFSRNDEQEADLLGIRTMKKAGYDPAAMASFFDLLKQQEARDPGRVQQFFSSHPAPADRATRMRAEAERLGSGGRRDTTGYAQMQDELGGRASSARPSARLDDREARPRGGVGRAQPAVIDTPSTRLQTFAQRSGFYQIGYPTNWRAYPASRGYGVVIAPPSCLQSLTGGGENIACGVILNHYEPFDNGSDFSLDEAMDDLVAQIKRSSPHLREAAGREQRQRIDGARGIAVVLQGVSPVTGETERVRVVTRELTDGHVLYALFVTPRDATAQLEPTFDRMIDSLRVDDRVAHR
ncbi:MAG: M48 family metallopeptidase [Burkholderiales bacterium]|jgi:Zn-dependent protease with chaperone function